MNMCKVKLFVYELDKTGGHHHKLIESRVVEMEWYNDPFDNRDFDEAFSEFMYHEEQRLEKELDKEYGEGYGYYFKWL